jgi:hypothetical protein
MNGRDPSRRIIDNPFYVLSLSPECTRAEVEREGQKLLGMLEIGLSAAKTYATPLGGCERSADKVREAMAELRDPERRLRHELWARLAPDHLGHMIQTRDSERAAGSSLAFQRASARLGWRR